MTSLEKFNTLIELEKKSSKVKLTTVQGKVYNCEIHCPAEDEDDWAYIFISPDAPTKYFIMPCDFIERIEELSDDEWREHLARARR